MCGWFIVFEKSKCSSFLKRSHGKMHFTKFSNQDMFSVTFYCQSWNFLWTFLWRKLPLYIFFNSSICLPLPLCWDVVLYSGFNFVLNAKNLKSCFFFKKVEFKIIHLFSVLSDLLRFSWPVKYVYIHIYIYIYICTQYIT